jgi:hypothetical protein
LNNYPLLVLIHIFGRLVLLHFSFILFLGLGLIEVWTLHLLPFIIKTIIKVSWSLRFLLEFEKHFIPTLLAFVLLLYYLTFINLKFPIFLCHSSLIAVFFKVVFLHNHLKCAWYLLLGYLVPASILFCVYVSELLEE